MCTPAARTVLRTRLSPPTPSPTPPHREHEITNGGITGWKRKLSKVLKTDGPGVPCYYWWVPDDVMGQQEVISALRSNIKMPKFCVVYGTDNQSHQEINKLLSSSKSSDT